MYRVMIVDDEPLILAGIASLLDWKEYGCEISGKAANGQQALKLMEEQKPDIVITDIKMPGMDGIGFMKAVKERGWDDVIFILLTNLEEFSLARQALSLGAVEYLVKMELTEEKLADSLRLAMERREMKRKAEAAGTAVTVSREEAVRGYIEKLLTDGGTFSGGASSGNAGEASAQNQGEGYDSCLRQPVLAIISFNYGYEGFSSDFTREDQKKVISFAENIIEQMVKGYFDHSCLVRRELNSLVLVMSTDGIEDYREQIRSLGEKIISVVKDYFEVSVSVAVSSRKESLGEFGALLYEAMSATNHYFYHSLDPVVFYSEECETSARHTGSFHIGFLKKDLSQAVALNDSGRLEEILDQVACLLREHNPSRQQAVNACANLYFFLSSFFEDGEEPDFPYEVNIMEKLGRLGTLGQIIQWINWFKEAVSRILERRRDTRVDKIAEMVREYVMEHYKERITLGQAAEALNISQGYLSTAFKKQSGESFTNYVSAIKIEKAKELIASHQYMMYEVSDLLGFDTPFYFSKVFKKVTGMSPKEYEAQCLKQKKL
ncbi:response regulator transcription factor [Enterocloster bolteae]|uniref:response regulator transcription factor n=1 Tax=Enterocloster bolteae TaxID=208479 RepID=UPI000E44D54F|nr:response regulator [Enterocloster bolteae]RGK73892.1 response regulator [Enterocloster bolteae]